MIAKMMMMMMILYSHWRIYSRMTIIGYVEEREGEECKKRDKKEKREGRSISVCLSVCLSACTCRLSRYNTAARVHIAV